MSVILSIVTILLFGIITTDFINPVTFYDWTYFIVVFFGFGWALQDFWNWIFNHV